MRSLQRHRIKAAPSVAFADVFDASEKRFRHGERSNRSRSWCERDQQSARTVAEFRIRNSREIREILEVFTRMRNRYSGYAFVVYGLVDPRDGLVRYIGSTLDADTRFQAHITEAKGKYSNSKKCNWVRELLEIGMEPKLIRIRDETGERHARISEANEIDKLPYGQLYNSSSPVHKRFRKNPVFKPAWRPPFYRDSHYNYRGTLITYKCTRASTPRKKQP